MAKKVIYTKHAEEMLSFRKIKKAFVKSCLRKPDKKLPGRKGRTIYVKNFGENDLKVVVLENEEIIVITLHWIAHGRLK